MKNRWDPENQHAFRDFEHRTENDWASLKDGTYYFGFLTPDGNREQVVLDLSTVRGKLRFAVFDLIRSNWNKKREPSDRFCDVYLNYWRERRKQNPSHKFRSLAVPGGNCTLSMHFLPEDTGMWLHRAAQFICDPRNLYIRPSLGFVESTQDIRG